MQRRRWLDEQAYADLVALCQFLPGPASSQVGMAIGHQRAGWLGALAAWVVIIAVLLAVLYSFKVAQDVSRLWVGSWFLAGSAMLLGVRVAVRLALSRRDVRRLLVRQVAVIGLGEHLPTTLRRLGSAGPALQVVAVLDLDGTLIDRRPRGIVLLRGFADLEERVYAGLIDEVDGGEVTIEISAGLEEYEGSTANGVTTSAYGSWSGSFSFPDA